MAASEGGRMSVLAQYETMNGAGEDLRYETEYMDLKTNISSGDFDAALALEERNRQISLSHPLKSCAPWSSSIMTVLTPNR